VVALSGRISLSGPEPAGRIQVALRRLALQKNHQAASVLSGTLDLSGSVSVYDGRFSFAHSSRDLSWASGELQGSLRGSSRELVIQEATGRLLGGRIGGKVEWAWDSGHRLRFSCWGRQLDPARLFPDWSGRLQIQGKGDVTFGSNPLEVVFPWCFRTVS
jgi:autotransporter translocation and assembly factor TamB